MGIEQLATIQLTHLNQDRPVVIRVVDIVHVDKEPNGGSEICLGVATGGWKVKVNESVADIQTAINTLWDQAIRGGSTATYTPSNVTTDRTYDADATSTAELADVLGTLIADLQTLGIVG